MFGQLDIGIGDSKQVVQEQQVLGVGVGIRRAIQSLATVRRDRLDADGHPQRRATAWKGIWLVCDSQNVVNTSTSRCRRQGGDLAHETAFADPGRPDDAYYRAVAIDRSVEHALNAGHLPWPPHESRFGPRDTARGSAMRSSRWAVTGPSARLIRTSSGSAQLAAPSTRRAVDSAEHHPTGRGDRFHPLRHPHLLTERGVTQVAEPISTGDDLAGVKADPQP